MQEMISGRIVLTRTAQVFTEEELELIHGGQKINTVRDGTVMGTLKEDTDTKVYDY